MTSIPIFRPPDPESTAAYMRKVQSEAPPLTELGGRTIQNAIATTRSLIATVLSAPLALAESGSYLAANVLALPSTIVFNPLGKMIDRFRKSIHGLSMKKPHAGHGGHGGGHGGGHH